MSQVIKKKENVFATFFKQVEKHGEEVIVAASRAVLKRLLKFHHGEVFFFDTTLRTSPGVWNIVPASARR